MINSVQQLIEDDEGRRQWPYQDTRGNPTWGIGHLLSNGLSPGVSALIDQAIDLQFQDDVDAVTQELDIFPWFASLDAVRRAATIDMAFNLGIESLKTFTTFLGYMSAHWWLSAADDLRHTLVYRQLPHRYERLATMIETGKWPT